MKRLCEGGWYRSSYTLNGREYHNAYLLTDGIYPSWSVFVGPKSCPISAKEKLFSQIQEACRKDVECAFGILQGRFHIIQRPALSWSLENLRLIWLTCILLHNLIVRWQQAHPVADDDEEKQELSPLIRIRPRDDAQIPLVNTTIRFFTQLRAIRESTNAQLVSDLMEHVWQWQGDH